MPESINNHSNSIKIPNTHLNQRHTRAQIIIVENGKFILLQHLAIKENKKFWGIPGGGVEKGEDEITAAHREAKEETGLDVKLLPITFEKILPKKRILYNRIITFLAYPVAGEAKTGYEPEADQIEDFNYRLIDMKWQDFYDDTGLDDLVMESMIPIRKALEDHQPIQKAGVIISRKTEGECQVLLISARKDPSVLVLPQGHIDPGEDAKTAAIREAREETGRVIELKKCLGFFLSEHGGKVAQTHMFSAVQTSTAPADEEREQFWLSQSDIKTANIPIQSRRLLRTFFKQNH